MQRHIQRTRRGDYRLRLPEDERQVLRSLPGQLRALLESDDPDLRRLFPPAYADDPKADAEYRSLMRDELLESRRRSLEVMEATIDAGRLDEEQMAAWLGALNDLRLVLGTKLDVTEETFDQELVEGDPQTPLLALFAYLGWLEEQIVEAMSGGLAPGGS